MNSNKILLGICIVLLTACSQIHYAEINQVKIPVELAVTVQQKEQGLMFRTNLTGGMLFTYDDEQPRHFWMKNTLIPLDMIFINQNNEIVTIHHAIPCIDEPCTIYPGNAKYVLETNGNFTIKNNIKEGNKVSFTK